MKNHRLLMGVSFLLAAGITACGGGGGSLPGTGGSTTGQNALNTQTNAQNTSDAQSATTRSASNASVAGASSATAKSSIYVDVGGPASGNWAADTDFTSGWTSSVTNAINTSKVSNAAPQTIYQTQRVGASFSYAITNLTPKLAYSVRLHFAETYFGSAGQRVFNVSINGAKALSNFDIFKAAGGGNVAVAELLPATADATGRISVAFNAVVNYAALNGIEVSSAAVSPTPTPSASPAPSPTPTAAPGLPYVFTAAYSHAQGNGNPFFTPVSALAKTQLDSAVVNQFWSPGLASGDSPLNANGPVYVVSSTINANAPQLTFVTQGWLGGPANGVKVHVPKWAVNQCGSASASSSGGDCHLMVIDYLNKVEADGWQCANGAGGGTYDGSLNTNQLTCTYGGVYPLGGNGLANAGDAVHGGFAVGMVDVTPQEILNAEHGTPIKHAFMIGTSCLNNPTVYPADTNNPGSDAPCTGDLPGNYPSYGDLVVLVSNPSVAISSHSAPCQAILKAMQTYGAYLGDTGGQIQMLSFSDFVYSKDPSAPADPWKTVLAQMVAGNDATGSYSPGGQNAGWSSCLQGLNASDFHMYQINKP